MALIRWQPREAFGLQREIDTLVNRFWGDMVPRNNGGWSPRVDVNETDEAIQVHAELPGMKREDVKVSFEKNVLTIEGERKQEVEKDDKAYYHRERSYGHFKRSFRLGTDIDSDRIGAAYKDGVLTVTLPKAETLKPRQIEVSVS